MTVWQFLSKVLEHGGTTALLYVLTLLAAFFVIRALWNRVRDADAKVAAVDATVEAVRRAEHSKRSEMRAAVEAEKVELERRLTQEKIEAVDAINTQLLELAEERRAEAHRYAVRIDELQEKRVAEIGAIVERVVRHVEITKNALDRLNAGLDVVVDLTKK